jgi:hypothetical protein
VKRSLGDAGTRALLAQRNIDVADWPRTRWTPEELTLAALGQHPETARARARASLARAQLQTAGLTPRSTLAPEIERTNERDPGQSAWSVGLALDLALTGASVRDARIERARLLADAALLDEADAAWSIRSAAQGALLELWSSSSEMKLLDQLVATQLQAQAVMQKRYDLGAADALELTATRTAAAQAETRFVLTEQRQIRARGELAQALALPLSAIDAVQIDYQRIRTARRRPGDGRAARRCHAGPHRSAARAGTACGGRSRAAGRIARPVPGNPPAARTVVGPGRHGVAARCVAAPVRRRTTGRTDRRSSRTPRDRGAGVSWHCRPGR